MASSAAKMRRRGQVVQVARGRVPLWAVQADPNPVDRLPTPEEAKRFYDDRIENQPPIEGKKIWLKEI